MDTLLRIIALLFIFGPVSGRPEAGQTFLCAGSLCEGGDRAMAKASRSTAENSHHAVVIFASFRGTFPEGTPAPDYARFIFNPNVEGSFSHFYREMSFGALIFEGEYLPEIYLSKRGSEGYGGRGYGFFNQEILEAADAEIDFSQYDNDGPDGRPNSGDDDGIVDFVFINVLGEIPQDFILSSATGIAALGLFQGSVLTNDRSRSGKWISIGYGTTQRVLGFHHAVGSMAHEYGHVLGLPDLYSTSLLNNPNQPPENDSAGIGSWGLMGLGAQGWNGDDGPNPFSAWERERLGWVGRNNDRLVTGIGKRSNVTIDDVETNGVVYKLPVSDQEYFLIENRQRGGGYYDRNIPGEGLLIWHINLSGSQGDETRKAVDLECADGLFADKGYPDGTQSDPVAGRDNLDFWAHDETYSKAHRGNTGDATDVFDGKRYTAFNGGTNPNSNTYDIDAGRIFGKGRQELFSGISVTNIRRQGSTMFADFSAVGSSWSGRITQKSVWYGSVHVSGDMTIEAGAELTILPGTTVEIEPSDDLSTGLDPSQVEINVAGTLKTSPRQLSSGLILLRSRGRWHGIRLLGPSAKVELQGIQVEGAADGISGSEGGYVQLNNFTIWGSSQSGIRLTGLNGTVKLQDGAIEENGEHGISIEGTGGHESSVRLTNITIRKSNRNGIYLTGMREIVFQGGMIEENGHNGISIEGTSSAESTVRLTSVTITGNGQNGMHLTRPNGKVELQNGTIENNGGDGIAIEGTGGPESGVLLTTVTVRKNNQNGIHLTGVRGTVEFQGGLITDNGGDGILSDGTSDPGSRVQLTSVVIRGNGRNGMHLTELNGKVELQNGTIQSNREDGILSDGEGEVILRSSAIQTNVGAGIMTQGVRLHVYGASIQGNSARGIQSKQGTLKIQSSQISGEIVAEEMNVECTNNYFMRNGENYVLEIVGMTGGTIQQNTFTLEEGSGVRIVSPLQSPVVRNNLFEGGDVGLSTFSSSIALSGNTFRRNRLALLCEGDSVPVLTFNTFLNNVQAIRNTTTYTTSAVNNWWGTDNVAEIGRCIEGPVSWQPFLIASPEDPRGIILGRSFPNPFNCTLTIPYQLSSQGSTSVILAIYDTAGQMIRILVDGMVQPGRHNAIWDGKDNKGREVASGIYMCKLLWGMLSSEAVTAKITVVR